MTRDDIAIGLQALEKLGLLGDDTSPAGDVPPRTMNRHDKCTVARHCLLEEKGAFTTALMEEKGKDHPSAALLEYFDRRLWAVHCLEGGLSPEKETLVDEIRANPHLFRSVWYARKIQEQNDSTQTHSSESLHQESTFPSGSEAVSRLLESSRSVLSARMTAEKSKESPAKEILEYLQERLEADTGLLAGLDNDRCLPNVILGNVHLFVQPEK